VRSARTTRRATAGCRTSSIAVEGSVSPGRVRVD
jgi:hypothetical protein